MQIIKYFFKRTGKQKQQTGIEYLLPVNCRDVRILEFWVRALWVRATVHRTHIKNK